MLLEASEIVLTDFRVFSASARREISSMIQMKHARIISRIGFVAQDMKDFQHEVEIAIQQRALEIGSNSSECILQAERDLEIIVEDAGEIIVFSAGQWKNLNDALLDLTTYEAIDEVDFINSLFEIELMNLFDNFNPVTNMFDLLVTYQTNIQVYFLMFDYSVNQVIANMVVHELASHQVNGVLFHTLDIGLQRFRLQGGSIIDSLANCHE